MKTPHFAPLALTPALPTKAYVCADGETGCVFLGVFACDGPCKMLCHTPELLPRAEATA